MWFCTQDGLYRFDGYTLTSFKTASQPRCGIAGNWTTDMAQDRHGRLWIASSNGLTCYDPIDNRFTIFRHDHTNPNSLSDDDISCLLIDRAGNVWVGTNNGGLNQLAADGRSFLHSGNSPRPPFSTAGKFIRVLCQDHNDALWIGTQEGLVCVESARHGRVTRYRHSPAAADSLTDDEVMAITEDRNDTLWIGTNNGGLDRFDARHGVFIHNRPHLQEPDDMGRDPIYDLLADRNGGLWIGTNGGGLYFRDPLSGRITCCRNSPNEPASLPSDRVFSLYEDRSGVIWVGTWSSGVSRHVPGAFRHYTQTTGVSNALSHNQVRALFEDSRGTIWIGTAGGGLNSFDRRTESFRSYHPSSAADPERASESVWGISEDGRGRLWIGTAAGLYRFEPGRGRFSPLRPKQLERNADFSVNHILRDRQGMLWIGTWGQGLYVLDPRNETFTRHYLADGRMGSLANNSIYLTYEDPAGQIWIGCRGGLNRFDRGREQFERFSHDPTAADSLSTGGICSIFEDQAGTLWVGSWSGGLNAWLAGNRRRGRAVFDHIGPESGFNASTVAAIGNDNQGALWVSSGNGLFRRHRGNRQFDRFDARDGTGNNHFNPKACLRCRDGELIFGGVNGFTIFSPDQIHRRSFEPPVVLTQLRKLNRPVFDSPPLFAAQRIIISPRDYFFSIEFSAFDYAFPERNRYAYRLDGFDGDWIVTDANQRTAAYTNLAPGRYRFNVRGSNSDGVWNDRGVSIDVIVMPPWWKTWWFRAIMLLTGILLLLGYVQFRLFRLRRHSLELEKLVNLKTAELNDLVLTDPLTGLRNRRYYLEIIDKYASQLKRDYINRNRGRGVVGRTGLGLLMLDIDWFKKINDRHGHESGDAVLRRLAEILRSAVRESDEIIRWGGEEFLIVALQADHRQLMEMAERIKDSIAETAIAIPSGETLHITCSLGVSAFPSSEKGFDLFNWQDILNLADNALYMAKAGGRNRIVSVHLGSDDNHLKLKETVKKSFSEAVAQGLLIVEPSACGPRADKPKC
jgi:diguanylate cyclase (GGDEF)-like protein